MNDTLQAASTTAKPGQELDRFDVIVIGAGVMGLCHLHVLREAGFSVQCFEAGGGVGGTWYWNRYPGCSFDSPSESYSFSFSKELLKEWDWKHYFSHQPDTEEYLNFVADILDLRPNIELNARVKAATWNDEEDLWEVELESGKRARASFLIPAVGVFGAPFKPAFEGADRFQGEQYHTAGWPAEDPDFTGKRVGLFGTGASGVQLIPELAKLCGHLTVFQRTPTYCLPSRNAPVDPEDQQTWKATYPEIHKQMQEVGILVTPDPRNGRDVPKEERLALYEEAWKRRGFEKFMVLFHDLFGDRDILTEYSNFLRDKIRERFTDPVLAEKFVPKDHLFQAKRVPLETDYYETFERDNVTLVDLRETPLESITEKGVKTSEREYEFDVIIYATGFDSVTGAVTSIDIRGVGGQTLKQKWDENGLSTYLGLTVAGFPNLFLCTVPALVSASPPVAEWNARWFKECMQYVRKNGYTKFEPTQEAEDAWVEHVEQVGRNTIFGDAEYSWYTGANVPGKKSRYLLYINSGPGWREECEAVIDNGWEGLTVRRHSDRSHTDDALTEPATFI